MQIQPTNLGGFVPMESVPQLGTEDLSKLPSKGDQAFGASSVRVTVSQLSGPDETCPGEPVRDDALGELISGCYTHPLPKLNLEALD